jgi:polysaccharide export outer membrane protein
MRLLHLSHVLIAAAALTGCAADPQVKMADASVPDVVRTEMISAYQIDSGDRLRVIVFGEPDLSNNFNVDQTGSISVPLIGAVAARGRTTDQVQGDIAARLRDGYLRSPDVSVEIDAYRPFFVMGEVKAGGQYPYVAGMSVLAAVAVAGGFTADADTRTVQVTRRMNGQIQTGRLSLADQLLPGDTIHVGERSL